MDQLEHSAWADNITVQGVAEMLHININVLNTITPDYVICVQPAEGPSPNTLYSGQIEQWHFTALWKLADVDQTQPQTESEAAEYKEEQEAFDRTSKLVGIPYDTLLQPEEQTDTDNRFSIAPGEHQTPCSILSDKNYEELAHPDKYVDGTGEFSSSRPKSITLSKYFNQRLLNCDGRFAKDIDYLLAAQYAVEAKRVKDQV